MHANFFGDESLVIIHDIEPALALIASALCMRQVWEINNSAMSLIDWLEGDKSFSYAQMLVDLL